MTDVPHTNKKIISIDDFLEKAKLVAIYPNIGHNITYVSLGLAGECGEFCEKVKKIIRDDAGVITTGKKDEMVKELGDLAWYLVMACHELNILPSEVLFKNIEKLLDRQNRKALSGSGDNR